MKRQVLIFVAFASVLALWSCGGKDNPEPTGPTAPTSITLSTESIEAEQAGGEYSLTVTAPSRPSVSEDLDWVTVKDGVYNSTTFAITYKIAVDPNPATQERSGSLTIKAGSLTKSVSVSQKGIVIPPVDKSKISKTPVNAKAMDAAKKLYTFLYDSYGVKTLSGVQSCAAHTNDYVNAVAKLTGKHPALAGYDFLFLPSSPTPAGWSWKQDYTDISNQEEHWNNGGVICYMWHWNAPKDEQTFRNNDTSDGNYAFYSLNTTFDIREALKEGTWQHEFVLQDIDEVAVTLKLLQDKGIPVLFRPLHEAAGNYGDGGAWFWWGKYGPTYCKQLWNLVQDRLQQHHGLNNILWVWTIDCKSGKESEAAQWYPGDDRVDIVGFDVYADDTDARSMQYAFMQKIVHGKKLTTISECGNVPSPQKNFTAGLPWSWFMVWSTGDANNNPVPTTYPLNTSSYWQELMNSEWVYTRESMPSLK